MVISNIAVIVAKAKEKADQGVDFSPRFGAVCPECGKKRIKIITSRPWEDGCKVRYHKCMNMKVCPLAAMGLNIKSVQSEKSIYKNHTRF